MKISFIKAPKPRRFVHKPIYYDPAKEERAEREERVKRELNGTPEGEEFKTTIKRGSFRRYRYDMPEETGNMQRERRMANIRLVIIIVTLLIAAIVLYLTSGAYLAL